MKIARFLDEGRERWGVVDTDSAKVRPIAGSFEEWAPGLTERADESRVAFEGGLRDLSSVRLLAPVPRTANIVAIGANYLSHLEDLGLPVPPRPVAFIKPQSGLIGPDDEITYPELTEQLDYEVELVAVVGLPAIADRGESRKSVLGYSIGNDVSARDLQFNGPMTGMDLYSGKALKRASSIGPWIVTRDEFGDDEPDLELSLTVNGESRQLDRTKNMIWPTDELLRYVDMRSGLGCGDAIYTGTPAGVGHTTGRYLEPGDVVVAAIERIGELRNTVGPRP